MLHCVTPTWNEQQLFFFCRFRFSDTQECLLPLKMYIKSRSESLWRTCWRRQSTEVNLINKFITLSAALWQDRAAPPWYVQLEASSEKIMSREEQDEIYFSFHHDCNKLIACFSHWTHWTRREAKQELSRETERIAAVSPRRAHTSWLTPFTLDNYSMCSPCEFTTFISLIQLTA